MGEFPLMPEQTNSFFCRNEAGMLLKTKERCGKSQSKAGMYMKIKEIRVQNGNVVEEKGGRARFRIRDSEQTRPGNACRRPGQLQILDLRFWISDCSHPGRTAYSPLLTAY
jgi:hypothetical protein